MAKKKEKKNKVTKETGLRRIGKEFGLPPKKFYKEGDKCSIRVNQKSVSAKCSFDLGTEKESVVIYPTTGTRVRIYVDNIWDYNDDDLLEEEEDIIDYEEEAYAWDDEE